MNKKLVRFVVRQYLKFDKTNPFISVIGILAFLGVAIGVMVLIIAMAIMNGTKKEFEDKLFTMNYPITIYPIFSQTMNDSLAGELQTKFPNFIISPYVSTQAILQSENSMSGAMIYGVKPETEKKINKVFASAIGNSNLGKYQLIVGESVALELAIAPNSKLNAYFTNQSPTALSSSAKLKRFEFVKTFKSGLNAYDRSYAYTSLESLQTILEYEENEIGGIHIFSPNPMEDIKIIKNFINANDIAVLGWWEQNGSFFAAMELEKKALFVVLMMIVLIASLNIISSLLMTIMSRRKEIALLLSLGASKQDVKSIFLNLGLVIGFSGILFGIFLGFFGMFLLDYFDIISLPADVYGTSKLPLDLSIVDFVSILIGSSLVVFLSSYYPATKATKIDVLNVLRNE